MPPATHYPSCLSINAMVLSYYPPGLENADNNNSPHKSKTSEGAMSAHCQLVSAMAS